MANGGVASRDSSGLWRWARALLERSTGLRRQEGPKGFVGEGELRKGVDPTGCYRL